MNVIELKLPVYRSGEVPGDISIPTVAVGLIPSSRYLTLAPSHMSNAVIAKVGGASVVGDDREVIC
jgi:hypothetical protein